jgi:Bardet-Biedl syndrome 9 protein
LLQLPRLASQDFRPSDLLLEVELGAPILGVDIGIFGSASQKEVMLAVLHPRRLVVYNVVCTKVQSEQGEDSFMSLQLLYKHSLARSAYNMCKGKFGGAQGKDYICVQSLDGELLFLEQERMAFSKFLPNFLVPGPICYIPQPLDAIVTVNSQMECEAFSFKTLAASSSGVATSEDKDNQSKRARAEWSVNLGENACAITCARHTAAVRAPHHDIIVLGERNVFWLKDTGSISTTKILDQPPLSMRAYPSKAGGPDNLLIATTTGQLLVYGNQLQLLWAAALEHPAVGLSVITAGSPAVPGLIASVSEEGYVCLSYMGTDPPSQVVNTAKAALNYDNMDAEHRRLLTVIREATADKRTEPTDRLVLRAQTPSGVDEGTDSQGWQGLMVTVKLFVSYSGKEALNDVTITVSAPSPFKCDTETQVLSRVDGGGGTPRAIPLSFRLTGPELPAHTTVTIGALYSAKGGEPRSVATSIQLPLRMCGKAVAPVKNAVFKITVDSNRQPPALSALFEDVCPEDGPANVPSVLTFMYHNGIDCTIIVSKNSGRYRIQAGNIEALYLVTSQLVSRLSLHFSGKSPVAGEEAFQVGYSEGLEEPLNGYFSVITRHFEARKVLKSTHDALEKSAGQFRLIEKRLLVRFKDRNPAPLKDLDGLLQVCVLVPVCL